MQRRGRVGRGQRMGMSKDRRESVRKGEKVDGHSSERCMKGKK